LTTRSLRRNREFMLLWSGQALSSLGSQVSGIAFPLLVLALTGSPAKAGIVGFAEALPVPLLALPAGSLADRVNRKHLMVASNVVRGLTLAAIPLTLATTGVPYALIVVVAFVNGAAFVASHVAERGVLRQLVAPEDLSHAVARNESRIFAALLGGPPLGGLLFGIGRAIPFVFDAVSYGASTVSLLLIRTDFQETREDSAHGRVADGLRWIWQRPFFRACALLFAGSNPVLSGLGLLVVVLARRDGASAPLIGVMLAVIASGGLLGALVAPALQHRLPARIVLIAENCAITMMLPLLLIAHNALLIGVIVAAAVLVTPVTNSIILSYQVALVPDRLQGRVQAASTAISSSCDWLGPLAVGLLLQHAGPTATILVLSGWMLFLATAVIAVPVFGHIPSAGDEGQAAGAPASASSH
jgi:predicted MFS family arabinose efflux permease